MATKKVSQYFLFLNGNKECHGVGFGKLCLFVIARTVVCVSVCIRIQVVHWFFVEISQ